MCHSCSIFQTLVYKINALTMIIKKTLTFFNKYAWIDKNRGQDFGIRSRCSLVK